MPITLSSSHCVEESSRCVSTAAGAHWDSCSNPTPALRCCCSLRDDAAVTTLLCHTHDEVTQWTPTLNSKHSRCSSLGSPRNDQHPAEQLPSTSLPVSSTEEALSAQPRFTGGAPCRKSRRCAYAEVWLPTAFTTAAGRPVCLCQRRLVPTLSHEDTTSRCKTSETATNSEHPNSRVGDDDIHNMDSIPTLAFTAGHQSKKTSYHHFRKKSSFTEARRCSMRTTSGIEEVTIRRPWELMSLQRIHGGSAPTKAQRVCSDDSEIEITVNVAAHFSGFVTAAGDMIFLSSQKVH